MKMRMLLFLAIIAIIVYGIILTMPTNNQTERFITAKGQNLYLHGTQFRSIGINRYNLLTQVENNGEMVGCANPYSDADIDTLFSQLHSLGITTVRFWLFQNFTRSGKDLTRFDYVLKIAEKYNLKVIPVLENHWSDCTEGDEKDTSWYASGYKSPYGTYPLSLKDYISTIVPLYKDNPTILAWEIMNEGRSDDANVLYGFAKDVSEQIKQLDSNHLVSAGMLSTATAATFTEIYAIKTIDFLDYHDYRNDRYALPEHLAQTMTVAHVQNKPMMIGEAGIKSSVQKRPELFQAKINAFFNNGGSVYMIWSYGDEQSTNDGYNFNVSDPLATIIKKSVEALY